MVRALPDFLINGCGKMISPIAIDTSFDLKFDRFAAELFGNLHFSYFGPLPCRLVYPANRLLETLQRRRVHDEMNRDFVPDWYLSRIGATQNSRGQFSRLFADLVKISAVIEQGPAIRFTWCDTEHRNMSSLPDQNH